MGIKEIKAHITFAIFILLFSNCTKKNKDCPKMGYEFLNTTSRCFYSPGIDSVSLGSIIVLSASVPKTFTDEGTNISVTNSANIINGPLRIIMLYPQNEGSVENFELTSEIGAIFKDTAQFSENSLKNFRTVNWDGSMSDSFRVKIKLKPLVRGVYIINLGQQGYRDQECALYKYFVKVGNSDQHLYYLAQYNNGYISEYERNYAYCFKVY